MADLLHSIRRFLWSISGVYNDRRCRNCGAVLTDEERTYYGGNCEQCEGFEFRRFEAIERANGVLVVGHACKLDGSICESRPDRCSDCPAGAGGKS